MSGRLRLILKIGRMKVPLMAMLFKDKIGSGSCSEKKTSSVHKRPHIQRTVPLLEGGRVLPFDPSKPSINFTTTLVLLV